MKMKESNKNKLEMVYTKNNGNLYSDLELLLKYHQKVKHLFGFIIVAKFNGLQHRIKLLNFYKKVLKVSVKLVWGER